MKPVRPAVLLLGPHLGALSGVSTHLNLLFGSRLADEFTLSHFQVGSEGRSESVLERMARLAVSPFTLIAAVLAASGRTRSASIVHINTSMDARGYWRDLAYMVGAKLCGARVLYQMHGGALPQEFFKGSRLLTSFLRMTLRIPDAIVVLAREELDAYREFVPSQRILAIPNAIDASIYAGIERLPSSAALPLKLLYIGRLHRDKGLYEALQGLRIAQAHGVRAHLVVAGSGPEEASLKKHAEDQGLGETVAFAGPVFGEAKLGLLEAADVFLLPSYREGLPYSLLESMAAGAPVVTTRVGGIPDVVIDGVNGVFVPCRDAHAIGRAIIGLAADRSWLSRMSDACRRTIESGYTIERQSEVFCRLYWDLRGTGRLKALSGSRNA
jgi:glycosyltransferase involved in cell wall biosynthesis